MIRMKDIRAELMELENIVTSLKGSIDSYENDIRESKRERSYDEYKALVEMYDVLYEKENRLHYIGKLVY